MTLLIYSDAVLAVSIGNSLTVLGLVQNPNFKVKFSGCKRIPGTDLVALLASWDDSAIDPNQKMLPQQGPRIILVSLQELASGSAGLTELYFGLKYDAQVNPTFYNGGFACCKVVDGRVFASLNHYIVAGKASPFQVFQRVYSWPIQVFGMCTQPNCQTCSVDKSTCLECQAPYNLKSGLCQSLEELPLGFTWDSSYNQVPCQVSCCARCSRNVKTCTRCMPGSLLIDNLYCVLDAWPKLSAVKGIVQGQYGQSKFAIEI